MSYQVLARKWRPQNFKQMVGQEHVLRALMNALDNDRLHHAYLFTGTRGVGKTTIARILAKCLNCETGITSTPCGECNSCKEIAAGNFLDLIEVDAASRTKVEDTRELLENVQYAPTRARFKVYLIDEVHMLTGHSFNALLKTLEEPPAHVKFLFATTDPQKLPATILSRCLQFNLKRMPVDMISGHLDYLLQQESIGFEQSALRLLARAADGSMRDALSLLDQAIAFSGAEISDISVRDMLGTISHEPLIDLLELIIAGDGAALMKLVEDFASVTPDFDVATDALISLLHQLAVQQVVPDAINEELRVTELANKMSKEEVQLFYQIALQGRRDLPLSPDPRSGFEMLLLRMLSFRPLREGMRLEKSTQAAVTDDSSKKKTLTPEHNSKQTSAVSTNSKIAETNTASQSNSQSAPASEHTKSVPPWEEVPAFLQDEQNQNSIKNPLKGGGMSSENKLADDSQTSSTRNSNDHPKTLLKEKPNIKDTTDSDDIENLFLQETPEERISAEDIQADQEVDALADETVETTKDFDPNQAWHTIVPQLKLGGRANELIKHCLLESHENGTISLVLNKDSEDLYADSSKDEIETALRTLYGTHISLQLSIAEAATVKVPEDKALETPAQRNIRKSSETQQQAEQNIESDPFVVELKRRFGAQIVPGSVQPK